MKMRLKTYKMATSILLKFLTLEWDISRAIWRIEVSDGSFFFIFHALSSELNLFLDRSFPLKNINGWLMSRSKRVKVHSFRGATVSDMEDYLKPLIKKRPARIILHCGTNNLNTSQPAQVAEDIRNLVNYIKAEGIDCTVSELVMRNDGLYNKVIEVNEKLRDILGKDTQIIEHSNIESSHLNNSRIHLNKKGDGKLAYRILKLIVVRKIIVAIRITECLCPLSQNLYWGTLTLSQSIVVASVKIMIWMILI